MDRNARQSKTTATGLQVSKNQVQQTQRFKGYHRGLPFLSSAFFSPYNNQLMHSRASLAIILIAMLLTLSLHGLKWQAMGSGTNNTVISEIWDGIEGKLNTALSGNSNAKNVFVNEMSERLNTRWAPAWNVVFTIGNDDLDTIFYGYAFNNQWIWYNGVPRSNLNSSNMVTLIVWKDYNCRNWKNIAWGALGEASSFNTAQINTINAEVGKMTEDKMDNDIWGTAYTMMKNLEENAQFSSGGYSVIMSQCGDNSQMYGRVCRVGDGFYC